MSDSSEYTHRNLESVEDMAAKHGFSEIGEVRFATGDLEAEQTGFSHHRLKPNARQGFGHKHDEAEEVYVVIAGSGRVKVDDEVVELTKLDAIRVSPGATRAFEGGDDGLEFIAFGQRHEGDGEIVPNWWSD